MFAVGEVVAVVSDQAKNYRWKHKYHLCVCCRNNLYLFINSNPYEGSFQITNAEFPSLPNAISYISCNAVLTISDQYMRRYQAKSKGALPRDVLVRLMDHVNGCEVITEEEREQVVSSLADALR